jgi:hypothetical protein
MNSLQKPHAGTAHECMRCRYGIYSIGKPVRFKKHAPSYRNIYAHHAFRIGLLEIAAA